MFFNELMSKLLALPVGVTRHTSINDINAASSSLVAQPLPANTKPTSSAPPLPAGQAAVTCGSAAKP